MKRDRPSTTGLYLGALEAAENLRLYLAHLSDEQRVAVLADVADGYCRHCGRVCAERCHCQNDE